MTVEIEAECEAYEQALQRLEQENAQSLSDEVSFRAPMHTFARLHACAHSALPSPTQRESAAAAVVLMLP